MKLENLVLRENIFNLNVNVKVKSMEDDALAFLIEENGTFTIVLRKNMPVRYRRYLKSIVRHELCHAKDVEEGLYDLYMRKTGVEALDRYAAYMYKAYTDYIAGFRFLRSYGWGAYCQFRKLATARLRELPSRCGINSFLKSLKHIAVLSIPTFQTGGWKNNELYKIIIDDFDYIRRKDNWSRRSEALLLETLALLLFLKGSIRDLPWTAELLNLKDENLCHKWISRIHFKSSIL